MSGYKFLNYDNKPHKAVGSERFTATAMRIVVLYRSILIRRTILLNDTL